MQQLPKLVIADEMVIVRDAISERLSAANSAEVVGTAEDGYSAIKVCKLKNPDILLMDISLTRPSGKETFRKLREAMPDLKIILTSSDASQADVFSLLSFGAVGYVPKQAKHADFVHAISSATLGYMCIPAEYMGKFTSLRNNVSRSGNIFGLSPREMEILEACTTGYTTKEIADKFSISPRTVETHRCAIYRKTSCHNMQDLNKLADQL